MFTKYSRKTVLIVIYVKNKMLCHNCRYQKNYYLLLLYRRRRYYHIVIRPSVYRVLRGRLGDSIIVPRYIMTSAVARESI